ncbi:heavy-metal-associated domain-containing protein [Pseudonocardia lacus]|uniref:heavy-metal-associated domain-containing protein n=1 Tax=Pseudonocardia lacus TaxID=2835865 RepID=UPI001BDD297C|nr:heavy-metal-associated domain-containing protein [Pseudonocardia lacus]
MSVRPSAPSPVAVLKPAAGRFHTTVTVAGMDCPHCVRSVTEGINGIAGVCAVHANLASGAVTVLADREVAEAEIAAAVDEAGYELVSY